MTLPSDSRYLIVLMISAIACACDVRTRRIPNALTFGGAALAIGYAAMAGGAGGLLTSVLGWLTGFALFLPFFLLGGMGAGDVKLVAALGAWLGPESAVWVALCASMAGGVLALAVGAATGYLRQALNNVSFLLIYWRTTGIRPVSELTLSGGRGPRLPYALPIAVGAVSVVWFQL